MQTLLVFAHTFWENSKANRTLLDSATNLDNVKIHNLSTAYPNGNIDVEFEMKLLQQSGKIIFQFPLFGLAHQLYSKSGKIGCLQPFCMGIIPKCLRGKHFKLSQLLGVMQKVMMDITDIALRLYYRLLKVRLSIVIVKF